MNNEIYVKISGLNLSRLINKLIDKNVLVNNLIIKERYIKFSICEKDLNLLNSICKEERKFYVVLYRNGLKKILHKIPYLIGSFIAILITSIYIFSFSRFVFAVNLTSNETYNLEKVRMILEENDIRVGVSKDKFTCKEIERIIMLNVDDVSGCLVEYDGGNLNIEIYPATVKQEVFKEDIISKYDAVVTEANSYAGTLKVKVGDTVKIGDVLIENNNGASGVVKGKVYFSSVYLHNEKQQIQEKTGNEFIVNNLKFFNKILINNNIKCDFQSYIIEKCDFFAVKNCFLPIVFEKVTYHEVIIKDKEIPFEEVQEKVFSDLKKEILNKVKLSTIEDDMISYSVVRDGSYVRVDCFVEVVMNLF